MSVFNNNEHSSLLKSIQMFFKKIISPYFHVLYRLLEWPFLEHLIINLSAIKKCTSNIFKKRQLKNFHVV